MSEGVNNTGNALVIGGGVAGIAAALRLGERGREATVFEADGELGGLARCLNFKGVSTDLGPHRIHTELPEIERLVSEICAPSLYTVKRRSRIMLRGCFMEYPPAPFDVLTKLGPLALARFGFSMAASSLAPATRPETYESIMMKAFGPALYDFMLRPYSAKVWKTDPSEIHPDTARVRVSAGSLAKMITRVIRREKKGSESALTEFKYVRGGIATLVRHLAERAEASGAELKTNSPVEGIDLEPGSGAGTLRATGIRLRGATDAIPGGAVISTAPLPVLLEKLLPAVPELADAREAASGLTYLNVIFVLVIVRRKIISGDNWLYFPEPRYIFNRAYESKSFDPSMGPGDKSVLCIEMTARPGDAVDTESDARLTEETLAQMESTGLFRRDEVEETMVHRLRYGYPLYSLDYPERLERVFAGLGRIVNLASTGRQGLFNHNNTDHSMLMGLRSAEALLAGDTDHFAERWYAGADEFKRFRIVD